MLNDIGIISVNIYNKDATHCKPETQIIMIEEATNEN